MKYLKSLIVIFIILLLSCTQVKLKPALFNVKIMRKNSFRYTDYFKKAEYQLLDTPNNQMISRIEKFFSSDDYKVVVVKHINNNIFIFDSKFKYYGQLYQENNPLGLFDVAFNPEKNEVFVLDIFENLIKVYNCSTTELTREINLYHYSTNICFFNDYLYLYTCSPKSENDVCLRKINTYDCTDETIIIKKIPRVDSRSIISSGNHFETYNETLLFSPLYSSTVYQITVEDTLKPFISVINTNYFPIDFDYKNSEFISKRLKISEDVFYYLDITASSEFIHLSTSLKDNIMYNGMFKVKPEKKIYRVKIGSYFLDENYFGLGYMVSNNVDQIILSTKASDLTQNFNSRKKIEIKPKDVIEELEVNLEKWDQQVLIFLSN